MTRGQNLAALPEVIVSADLLLANELIAAQPTDIIVTHRDTRAELLRRWSEVDAVFTDADGTIVEEGAVVFAAKYGKYIRTLAERGVTLTVVTGKPLAEVSALRQTIPPDVPIEFICEKGAYAAVFLPDGTIQKKFVLGSASEEASMAALRTEFEQVVSHELVAKYRRADGSPGVTFGWSGSGEHTSILSIDIFAGQVPEGYLSLTGAERDALKLKDQELIGRVERDLERFVAARRPGWRVVHLGNGNTDIAPVAIEKDAAIKSLASFQRARRVLVWGDTYNDLAMFRLRGECSKVEAGLVAYREVALSLRPEVDSIVFGMANVDPYFRLLLHATTDRPDNSTD